MIGEWHALVERWRAFLSRVDVGGPLPARLEIDQRRLARSAHSYSIALFVPVTVTMATSERNTGLFVEIRRTFEATGEPDAEQVRSMLQTMYMHELDEQLRVDGALAFDPHPGGDG